MRTDDAFALRTYLDLSHPADHAPLHVWRPWFSWLKLRGERPLSSSNLQRLLPPGFRHALARESPAAVVALDDPAEIPHDHAGEHWLFLQECVRNYAGLDCNLRYATLGALLALGFFKKARDLQDPPSDNEIRADSTHASIGCAIAAATVALSLHDDEPIDLSSFERVASLAPVGSKARFEASIELVVQCAKHTHDLPNARKWRANAEKSLDAICREGASSFEVALLQSRFYRSAAFVPFLENNRKRVFREMELCEHYARIAAGQTDDERILERENLVPMLQSRAKEARWLGDLDLAKARLQLAVDADPRDSVRWIELGEIELDTDNPAAAHKCYLIAAAHSPPGSSLSWHMAGEAAHLCGDVELACAHYYEALKIDPMCISAATRLQQFASKSPRTRSLIRLAHRLTAQQRQASGAKP